MWTSHFCRVTALSAFFAFNTTAIAADVPEIMAYQGRIAVEGAPYNGQGQFKFALVNEDGSTTWWSNDGSSVGGSEPSSATSIPVQGGLFAVLLGDQSLSNMVALPPNVFSQDQLYLRIWFDDGANGFIQLGPDSRLTSTGFAMVAQQAYSVSGYGADDFFNASSLATGTVPVERLPVAGTTTNGVMRPDGTTLTVDEAGVISFAGSIEVTDVDSVDGVHVTAATDGRLTRYDSTGTGLVDSNLSDAVTGNTLSLTGELSEPRSFTLPDTDVTLSAWR